jgi:hypothetical protein
MIGMIIFGTLADMIGRNAAGIMTSLCMLGGVTVMAFSKYLSAVGIFILLFELSLYICTSSYSG